MSSPLDREVVRRFEASKRNYIRARREGVLERAAELLNRKPAILYFQDHEQDLIDEARRLLAEDRAS